MRWIKQIMLKNLQANSNSKFRAILFDSNVKSCNLKIFWCFRECAGIPLRTVQVMHCQRLDRVRMQNLNSQLKLSLIRPYQEAEYAESIQQNFPRNTIEFLQ